MARTLSPHRDPEPPLGFAPPPAPVRAAALADLHGELAALVQRITDSRAEVKAVASDVARQGARLEELARLQAQAAGHQREVARGLAELRRDPGDAPPAARWPGALAVARGLAAALRRRWPGGLVAQPPPAAAPEESAPPRPNWVLADAAGHAGGRAVLVLVLGLAAEEQRAVVARLGGREPAAAGIVPVYVTDRTEFEPFRAAHALFEHLPLRPSGRDRGGARGRDPGLYAARRFELLCDKWKPLRVVGFGPAAVAWLAAEARGPRLPPAVKELLAAGDDDGGQAPALPGPAQG